MNMEKLVDTARALVAGDKGLLAMDESDSTCNSARFAKWRAVILIGAGLPSQGCLEANAHALARDASLCQEAGPVPVVEPEVLMDSGHSLQRSCRVIEEVLRTVFYQLYNQRVMLEGMILKPNMVFPGLTWPPLQKL